MRRAVLMPLVALVALAVDRTPGEEKDPMSKAALEVSIAVPEHRGARSVVLDGPKSHFHVVVRNVSPRPLALWRQWCSFGHDALFFEYATPDGKKGIAHKKPGVFLQNLPDPVTLPPGEEVVLDVYFGSDEWVGFPLPEPGCVATVSLRAVYQIAPGPEAQKHGVWTGKVTSNTRDYRFETRPK